MYAWSIGQENAQIVEHRSLLHKLPVNPQFRMSASHFKSK